MEKLKILFLLLALLIIPLCRAEIQSLGEIPQGSCIQLVQSYSNSTYTNLTKIQYPDKHIVYYGTLLDKHGSDYNLSFCDTNLYGEYQVTVCTDVDGIDTCVVYRFFSGIEISPVKISIYILFLIICLMLIYLSGKLIKDNRMSDDKITDQQLYQMKKVKELGYYIATLKRKLWIVGVFGIYLSLLVFTFLLSQIVYNLGLNDLNSIFTNVTIIMSWGLIPFVLFWIAYIIIYIYKSTTNILKYQFGSFRT